MSDIIMITLLVVATVATVLHILPMCKMIKDTDRRNKEKLKNKRMANAEPVRELKYKTDTGLCITKCPYVLDSIKIGSNKCGRCIHNRGYSTKKKVVFCALPDAVAVNKYSNAEPEEYRCCMCSKKFTDGRVFKQYKNKWYCINCYLWVLNVKNESFIKKVKAHFLEERKKQAESEKAGDK